MHKAHDAAHSRQTVERGAYGKEYQRKTREGEIDADISHPKDSAPSWRFSFCECVFYKVRRGNTNVESTMAEVDKDAEKRTQYNRIRRKMLMIIGNHADALQVLVEER